MSDFSLSRSVRIDAPADRVHALIDDLREWQQWSPWEGMDPDLERTYTGPVHGVGARYAWSGNRKAGAGHMQITRSEPHRISLDLVFTKPFAATNEVTFTLDDAPGDSTDSAGGGTLVTWTMTGRRGALMRLMARVLRLDDRIGRDFDKGLAALKAAAER